MVAMIVIATLVRVLVQANGWFAWITRVTGIYAVLVCVYFFCIASGVHLYESVMAAVSQARFGATTGHVYFSVLILCGLAVGMIFGDDPPLIPDRVVE
ncbi:MAG TPA: hypothetical protein VI322_05720, partial [Candidatus Saccharimonadia bacterium]